MMTEFFQTLGMNYEWAWFVATIAGILLIALPLMLGVAMIIYADRKIWAAMALRRGPNVVGPFGLLQSFADGLKVFLQETIIPSASNKGLFLIAPIITFTVALMAWAVIPFNSGAVLADLNVGLLYVLAISSLGVYGVLTRRNAVLVLLSVELMLAAVNINLVAFDRYVVDPVAGGQIFSLFVIAVAAAEVGIGLAIVLLMYRNRRSIDLTQADLLKG